MNDAAQGGSSSEEVVNLRKEVKVLEAALEATEQRVEALDKEARAGKSTSVSHQMGHIHNHSPAPKAAPTDERTRADKASRRRSQNDMSDLTAALANPTSHTLASAIGGSPTPTGSGGAGFHSISPHHGGGSHMAAVETSLNMHLLEQVEHWRRVAMKRLSQSLVKLPDLSQLTAQRANPVQSHDSIVAQQVDYPSGNVVQQPNVFSRHVELVGYDAHSATTADFKSLYRKLRLLRAASARIGPIPGASAACDQSTEADKIGASSAEALRSRIKARSSRLVYRIPTFAAVE